MHLDLSQLGRHGRAEEHVDRTYAPADFDPPDEAYRVVGPVHLVLDVRRAQDAIHVAGRLEATLELECGRCLEPYRVPVQRDVDLRYVPEPTRGDADEQEREIAEDDLTTAYYRDAQLDLGELMREQFELALPMKPLCREECQGLCPQCGANQNREVCGCAPRREDPRLAALKGLLDRQKEN